MKTVKSAVRMVREWLGHFISPCEACPYAKDRWCVVQYKSCQRGRQEDADCGPYGKLWEQK